TGLQPAHGAGEREHARVVDGGWLRGRAGVHGRVFDEPAVVGPQHIEAPVLTADTDDFGRLAVHVEGQDLRRVADRLVFVETGLRVVGAHRAYPQVAGIDLRAPL